jgi:hypothetical protein
LKTIAQKRAENKERYNKQVNEAAEYLDIKPEVLKFTMAFHYSLKIVLIYFICEDYFVHPDDLTIIPQLILPS